MTHYTRSEVPQAWIDEARTGILLAAKLLAVNAELTETGQFVNRIDKEFRSPVLVEELQYSFRHLRELMESEMQKHLFLSISPKLADFYEKERPLGDDVYNAFPLSRFDLTEAGTCLACGNNVAAAFHCMRAAEVGLRELGRDRQIPVAVNGKIEFAQWGAIISELEDAVKKIQHWPNSAAKEEAHKFYNSALMEIRAFNDGWRRHAAHVRSHPDMQSDEALALWGHVSRFMEKLATKISEGTYTPLTWT
jgi:hypothetical protein